MIDSVQLFSVLVIYDYICHERVVKWHTLDISLKSVV